MRLLALVSVVILAVVGSGCEQKAAPPKPPAAKTFVLITNFAAPEVQAGADVAAKEAGNVTIDVKPALSAAAQVNELDRIAASRAADGVAIDCVADPEVSKAIAKCVMAGIPVVTYNSDCPGAVRTGLETPEQVKADPGRHTFIGTSPQDVGRILGRELAETMGDSKGVVAIISGPENPTLTLIEQSAGDYLRRVPGVTVREPVRPAYEPDKVAAAVKDVLRQEPNARGWLILNPAAVPDAAAQPLEGLASSAVVMLSVRDSDLDAVRADRVDVLVVMPFMEYGCAAVNVLAGITRDHSNFPDVWHIGPLVADRNNVDAVKDLRKRAHAGGLAGMVAPRGGAKPNQPQETIEEPAPPVKEPPVEEPTDTDAPADDATSTETPADASTSTEAPAADATATETPAEDATATESDE